LKIPVNTRHTNSRFANQEKADQREIWHKLVVKIINWKDGGGMKTANKITPKEWNTYYKRMLKTNTSYAKQRVLSELQETKEKILKNGGFEDPSN
jgi:hypothetical protein